MNLKNLIFPKARKINFPLFSNKITGIQPLPGPVGLAYALRSVEICCVCQSSSYSYKIFNDNFKQITPKSGDPADIIAVIGHRVCGDCSEATEKKLLEIDDMNPIELPLYVSDENIFIKKRVADLLKGAL